MVRMVGHFYEEKKAKGRRRDRIDERLDGWRDSASYLLSGGDKRYLGRIHFKT